MRKVIEKIRRGLWKILGSENVAPDVKKLKEEVVTLQYFLNNLHDIRSVPSTVDKDLRFLQLCDAHLLAIIDKICRKHSLCYWLDFGTLLGGIRHEGFIPWDDDTDMSMPRSDYEKITNIINDELGQYGITAEYGFGRIGVGYRHQETAIWADIFPVDDFYTNRNRDEIYGELHHVLYQYLDMAERSNSLNQDVVARNLRHIIDEKQKKENDSIHYLYYCPRFSNGDFVLTRYDDIFPLSEVKFEGVTYWAPNQTKKYLESIYGDYMNFPKSGVLHHGIGRRPLSLWAQDHSVDMNEVQSHLAEILDRI